MSFYLNKEIDFQEHNQEVKQLMEGFKKQEHKRVPVQIGGSIRNLLSNPEINKTGFTFKDFFTNWEAQLTCQLEYQYWCRHNLLCDCEMGLPEDCWNVGLDFQNSHSQAWFGAPFIFFGDEDVPDTVEILKETPEDLYKWENPDPFWGRGDFIKHAAEMYEKINGACDSGYEFHGLPVRGPKQFPVISSDGIFTIALKLRGTVETMIDMMTNPDYYHHLMDYITRNLIARRKKHLEWFWDNDADHKGEREFKGSLSYADDSIAMISTDQFREFVLPYWRRFFNEFHNGKGCSIHLCGDATHHFPFLKQEFNIKTFDTGFPVDHGKLRTQLGPDVQINGGPTIMLLKDGKLDQIEAETKRICGSGVMEGKRFILIAANNLAPCTPIENTTALYEAGKKYGRYE